MYTFICVYIHCLQYLMQLACSHPAGGFWDNPEPVKVNKAVTSTGRNPGKPNTQNPGSKPGAPAQNTNNNRASKKKVKDESDNVKKLFADSISPADSFTQWCKGSLHTMKVHASIDSKYK